MLSGRLITQKYFVAARDHTLGASIVSGNLPAAPNVSWQAGLAYSMAYLKAIWQALLLGLVLGAGIEALLPRMTLGRLFDRFDTRKCLCHSLDDAHVLQRSDCGRHARERCWGCFCSCLLACQSGPQSRCLGVHRFRARLAVGGAPIGGRCGARVYRRRSSCAFRFA
jgi:hypothetical protein